MCNDPQMPVTLAIADSQMDLRVIRFTGLDALNEVYSFDIDLISTDAALDPSNLIGRSAFLSMCSCGQGIHGLIQHAIEIYTGRGVKHCRLVLMPALQTLALHVRRRAYHEMSAPQLIVQLLESHGLDTDAYRFEHMTGVYPLRAVCIQYDESDLHLLQRLCEEEGIHFRFEHTPDRHVLVFSDDPVSFPEQQAPMHFRAGQDSHTHSPTLAHFAEQRSARIPRPDRRRLMASTRLCKNIERRRPHDAGATNDSEAHASQRTTDQTAVWRQQRSARQLERLRCEQRDFRGYSHQPGLCSGEIMQVLDHPEPLLNDQWLLIEVRHAGRQLQALEGVDPHDIAAIIDALPTEEDWSSHVGYKPGTAYMNRMKMMPWAMAFRPSIKHPKPKIYGLHSATLMPQALVVEADADVQGLRPIRFDWQKTSVSSPPLERWPLAQVMCSDARPVARLRAGTRVVVAHLDNDPDRPVICGPLGKTSPTPGTQVHLEGIAIESPVYVHLRSGQQLRIESDEGLKITGRQTELKLMAHSISVLGNATRQVISPQVPDRMDTAIGDLRLTRLPGLQGEPLAGRIWYIVRMREPGLHHLARLEAEHFLFDGTTDDLGYLGLCETDRKRLAEEYRKTPHHLWLVHPGECVALHAYFQQNWTQQQRDALTLSRP